MFKSLKLHTPPLLHTKTGTLTPFVLLFLTWLQIYSWFVMDFSTREERFFFTFFLLCFCHFLFLNEVFEFCSAFSLFPRPLHFLPTLGATDPILEAADTDLASWWRRDSNLRTLRWVILIEDKHQCRSLVSNNIFNLLLCQRTLVPIQTDRWLKI